MRRAGPRLNRVRIVKGALRRLLDDECLDRAAGLSFYALLSAAPAILAMVSLLGVVGEAESTTKAVLSLVHGVSAEAATAIRPLIVELTESSSAGVTLIGSLLLAIWSSSKYIGALGRALNAVYRVEETRPYWKFKPLMLLMTVVTLIVLAALGLLLVLSGPIAETLGDFMVWAALYLAVAALTRLLFFIPFPQKKKKDRDEDIYAAFHAPLDEGELSEDAPLVMSAEEGELQLAHVDSLIGSLREKELAPADRLELDAVARTLEDCRGRALTAAEQRTLNDCLSSVLKLSAKYSL